MFTARIAYNADLFQSQVPRTKRFILYLKNITVLNFTVFLINDIACIAFYDFLFDLSHPIKVLFTLLGSSGRLC